METPVSDRPALQKRRYDYGEAGSARSTAYKIAAQQI
jgi:hypothetical protein